ncbi:hypothetical protein LO762_02350 [Actinocorallia sp. API 0066]|uniref:hypothetical protein n=1 Tax=Actinocorallia sp. API 0066 TaxID=2896846 RepID=UPI001E63FCF9|nr:hypothetical protein [Actinocorallia sp. API 0066]MCD0448042.1 hypothetical protein [Actinocorallia sp. API 0066]
MTTTPPTEVRLRPSLQGSGQALGVVILLSCSVLFFLGGLTDPGSVGGVVYLLLGATGIVAFGAVLVVVLGHLLGRRPLLVLEDDGVRIPARWPLPRSGDRVLPWSEIAAVCAWSQGVPTGRGLAHQLAFLPVEESPQARHTAGAEMLMVKTQGLPGVPVLRWNVATLPGWTVKADEVIAEVRRRTDAPFEDRRIGLPKRRKVVRQKPRPAEDS